MESVRKQSPVLFVSAGNCLFKRERIPARKIPQAREIARLMVDAYNEMGLAAMGVGAYDLSLGVDFLLDLARRARFPFVCANLTDPHGTPYFPAYRIVEAGGLRVALVGVMDSRLKRGHIPGGRKVVVAPPLETVARVIPRVAQERPDLIVVLTDMSERRRRLLARKGLPVDLVVGTSRRNQLSVPFHLKGTLIVALDRRGKTLGRVDVIPKKGGGYELRNSFIPLLQKRYPDHPRVGKMVRETLARIRSLQAQAIPEVAEGGEEGCGQDYVGAETCRRCHGRRYAHWKHTPHARAYETLRAKGKELDTECLACHTVAFECSNGKPDRRSMEQFPGVQCESCHGPGSAHAASEGRTPVEPGLVCAKCHTRDRSDTERIEDRASEACAETD